MMRTSYVMIIAFCLCAAAVLTVILPDPDPPRNGLAAADASDFTFSPHVGARLPLAAPLVDEHGRMVTLGDYFARSPVILMLEYLQCTSLCGVTLRNLFEALNRLPLEAGRDYQLVTVSIDPRDKPSDALAARTKYGDLLDRRGNGTGIHFLAAETPAEMREIADAIGFPYRYDTALDAYVHPAGFVVAAPDGVISRYIQDVAISSQELIGALADARQRRTSSPLSRFLLLCKVRTPTKWLATPVLMALTIANIAAAFMLAATFAAIWRRRV